MTKDEIIETKRRLHGNIEQERMLNNQIKKIKEARDLLYNQTYHKILTNSSYYNQFDYACRMELRRVDLSLNLAENKDFQALLSELNSLQDQTIKLANIIEEDQCKIGYEIGDDNEN